MAALSGSRFRPSSRRRSAAVLALLGLALLPAATAKATIVAPATGVRPVIGKATTVPARAEAGKRFTVSFRVTRSDTGKPLTRGKLVCDPSVAGKALPHAESFRRGIARLAFTVPRTAELVRVRVTITLGGRSATRITSFRVRPVPKPRVSIDDVSSAEGNVGTSVFVFAVRLSAAAAQTVKVDYRTVDGTATSPGDYQSAGGTLTFRRGEATKTITVLIVGDTTVEEDETFTLVLADPVNATLARRTATGTVANDDAAWLSIADASAAEGNGGTTTLAFEVTLSAASTRTVSVEYQTAAGSATAGADYVPASGTLTFLPGETTKAIPVTVVGDTTVEPDETFPVVLTSPANATLADHLATGTIRNDDAATFSIGDTSATEGNTGTSRLSFVVTLSAASTQTVSVGYATADGSATAGDDYTAASGTLAFTSGETTRTLTVAILGDIGVEPDETFSVVLSSPDGATLAKHIATGTIANDDTTPRLEITGPEELVYDWSTEHCADFDMPDLPARAIRSADGEVQLYLAGSDNRRLVGPDLGHLHHDCAPAFVSHLNDDPAAFDDWEWLAAPYTTDGRTVYSLVHMEHALAGPPNYDALTLAVSNDGGRTFQHAAPPTQLVASIPDRARYVWTPTGWQGMAGPSNIVHGPDGFYYAFALVKEDVAPQTFGNCLLRTSDLADPHAWRGWRSDRGWNVTFVNPYLEIVTERAAHICEPLPGLAQAFRASFVAGSSLTYNTYLERYVLVSDVMPGDARPMGFYFTTSVDLIHWTPAELIAPEPLGYSRTCPNTDPVMYVSLIDPESTSPSFETAGQTAYLYFSRWPCGYVLQHDLLRVPVRFTR